MKKNFTSILFCFLISITAFAQENTFFEKTDAFLKEFVNDNKVDYDAIKKKPTELDEIVKIIAKFELTTDENTTKAFLVNAYNILVIKSIVAKFPIKSPMDVGGFFDKTKHTLAGKSYTLNDIENKLIREKYNDARFHFVLVCGANGCPPIIATAYVPKTIENQLTRQTTLALDDPSFLRLSKGKVSLSQIFEWYKVDFGKNAIDFINKYRTEKIDAQLKIGYYSYDWSLNIK
jgi:hypothetical protein